MSTQADTQTGDRDRAGAVTPSRVVIVGMNYAPELTGVGKYSGEIGEYLVCAGLDVTVVTAPPHYPGWSVRDGWSNCYSHTIEDGVRIYRTPLLLRRNMKGIWRLLAPLSFALSAAPVTLYQILRRRPMAVLCIEPTLLAAPVAQLGAWLIGARTVLHVQDLEVDAAFEVGHLRSLSWLRSLTLTFERFVLSHFDQVITISNRMGEKLMDKGVLRERLAIVRNWVDTSKIYCLTEENPYRRELCCDTDDFVVLYSGNIGPKQGLHVLLDAAARLRDRPKIKFVIAGEGPSKAELQAAYGHLANVRFLSFQPVERFNAFLNFADLHALPQDHRAADLVLPSKLGGMLASGRPIVVTADPDSELAVFLDGTALLVPAGDEEALADAIERQAAYRDDPTHETRLELARTLSKGALLHQLRQLVLYQPVTKGHHGQS